MSKEIHISSRALVVRTNGVFSPTDRGHLAHELIRVHRTLRNCTNPKKTFAMSEDLKQKHIARREELCGLLGLLSDEKVREKQIQGFDGYLRRVGFPYYRINIK